MVKNKKNMFFLQVFFYICLWIVEVFSRSDVIAHFKKMQKYIFIFFLISSLAFGQNSNDQTNTYIKKFRKEMKKKNIIEFFLVNHVQHGIVPGINKVYAFWREENKYYLKAFDKSGEFLPIKLTDERALIFYLENYGKIKVEEVERYKRKPDSIVNGKKYSFLTSQSHSALRYFTFYNGKVKFEKFLDEHWLTTNKENPNINYETNSKLALVKLNSICNDVIYECINNKIFFRIK
jgi:hypothetical protein